MGNFDDDEFADEFDDVEFDESTLRRLEAIEASAVNKTGGGGAGPSKVQSNSANGSTLKAAIDLSDDTFDNFEDEELLRQVELAETQFRIQSATAGPSRSSNRTANQPQAGPSRSVPVAAPAFKSAFVKPAGRQMTLFGEPIAAKPTQGVLIQANHANGPIASITAQQATEMIGNILNPTQQSGANITQRGKTKQWDFSQPVSIDRQKQAFKVDPDDFDLYDEDGFQIDGGGNEQFDLPPPPVEPDFEPLKQMKVQIDREAAKTWIYPTNKEKRDYQFNIVQRALFNNVLVALPTGLGKTFIAAVVILNYFRWFPTGKIIFVAPTKPLVAQQQIACHGICGLPWDTAIEMTGETRASLRAEEWKTKRIFYMTPQTFENDLCSTAIDAEDVVCVVVDEAHRATGNYAYGKVVRHLMARNPFFRVLALTATPGSNNDKVQEVVDSLHINLIEIRQEDALDIRQYVHSKDEDPVVVPLRGVVRELRDLMSRLMKPLIDILAGAGLMQVRDPAFLSPFQITMIQRDPRKRDTVNKRKLYPTLKSLAELARAMEFLVRYSVTMFASRMFDGDSGIENNGKKSMAIAQQAKFKTNSVIREMRRLCEENQDKNGNLAHPKMDYLQNVVAAHFAQAEEGASQDGVRKDTRIMVFCSLRECVMEIIEVLNLLPMVKATKFVGQSADTKGNKGLRQKEQEQIVADFKKGDFNVLVATSIGEEGLDIGEVDLIISYDAVKNAVRMLQRIGRTGRKRQGRVVVLMSEGPEERNWQQSKDQYKSIQHEIIKGVNLSLFDDVERLVPQDITSMVRFEDVDQPPFEPSMIRDAMKQSRSGAAAAAAKRKRNTDPMRNVPDGALTGFMKVSAMRKTSGGSAAKGKGKKGTSSSSNIREGAADLTDEEDHAVDSLHEEEFFPPSRKRRARSDSLSDIDDIPVLTTTAARPTTSNRPQGRSLGTRRPELPPVERPRVERQDSLSSLEDFNVASANRSGGQMPLGGNLHTATKADFISVDSQGAISVRASNNNGVICPGTSSPVYIARRKVVQIASDDDDDDDADLQSPVAPVKSKRKGLTLGRKKRAKESSPVTSSPPLQPRRANVMGPPFAAAGKGKNKAKVVKSSNATSKAKSANSSAAVRKKRIGNSPSSKRLFAFEADRSTDEEDHGERDENDEGDQRYEEDSSDREHVGEFEPTQAPRGYGQQAVYMRSLLSQEAPTPFRKGNVKRANGRKIATPSSAVADRHRRRPSAAQTSSSHLFDDDDSDNQYEVGSFICSDDDEILYETEASQEVTSTM